ncbi:related to PHO84 - high-affinity inorganic phosphate transporter [Melanopsichium pennsylvanicum]|uniref:Related to PHO84 - high-affinity inorganic phosphate transporter n=2 Tax=Melanopsichium pennsylvanicum TaxID=63383 RepID=A0AAJ4XFH8_9BASI|nr:mfs general substrate transporter [Melanopsichium pennsylvanicum 4]SNX81397.1 related to PHO84 - high-affinity inorganic phosphate transporter [Melanopsichium pennsylvanicum]
MLTFPKRANAQTWDVNSSRKSQETDEANLTEFSRMAHEMGVSGPYERKVALVNKAIKEDIGFGCFQIWLTWLAGFGWFVDNIWFQALSMSLPQIKLEFGPAHVQFATLALYLGLLIGATFWGFISDVIGRRPSWNITLFISAVFGIAVGGAPNFIALGALLSCLGLGLGGNLPVDGAMLIEFIPSTHQWILTFLSIFWCFGQLFAAFIGWAFITNYRCETADNCPRASNMGWRYTWYVLGAVTMLMWMARFWVYPIPESPKYLIGKGRDEEAMEVLRFIAAQNGKQVKLTLEQLKAAGDGITTIDAGEEKITGVADAEAKTAPPTSITENVDQKEQVIDNNTLPALTTVDVEAPAAVSTSLKGRFLSASDLSQLRRSLGEFDSKHLSALFATRRMAWNTTLICFLWGLIGLAYPLYNAFIALYLQNAGANQGETTQAEQYRDLVIIAACGIPGSFVAAALVELPYAGRRGTMAFFTMLTGLFLFLFTTARTPAAVLGWNCATSLVQNAMYAVLYAISYEVFPAPNRGTGDGLAMATQRVFGVIAPVVGAYAGSAPTTPIYVSASFFMAAAGLMLLLPYETRGRSAL